jgi:hypothetical protein
MEAAVDLGWTLHKSSTLKKSATFKFLVERTFCKKKMTSLSHDTNIA